MRLFLPTTFIFIFLASALSHAKLQVPNRQPHSTFEISWSSLSIYFSSCLNLPTACKLSSEEIQLLERISGSLNKEPKLQYVSAKERPGFFSMAGTHRVAMTGLNVGDVIYINTDEILTVDYFGSVAILTHELGHHQGIRDTEERVLDRLGSKLREFLLSQGEITTLAAHNQSQVGIFAFNPGPIEVGGPSSQLLLFDSQSVTDLGSQFAAAIPCPLTLSRRGGVQMYQPRTTGLFDWNPTEDLQDFGFSLDAQEHCSKGKDSKILFLTIDLVIPLVPKTGAIAPNWWNTHPGIITEGITVDIIERGTAFFQDAHGAQYGIPLKILNVQSKDKNLSNGSSWTISATVETPMNLLIESCSGRFTSPQFVNYGYKKRYQINFQSCRLTKISTNSYQLELVYTFPKSTPSRDYRVETLSLKIQGQNLQLTGRPTHEENIRLQSLSEPPPLEFKVAALTKRGLNGQPVFVDTKINTDAPSKFHFTAHDLFAFQTLISSTSPLLRDSHFCTMFSWIQQGTRRENDSIPIFAEDSTGRWHFPFNGGSQVAPYPNQENIYFFQTTLNPQATSGPAVGNEMLDFEFSWIWMINENLQEFFKILQVKILIDR